METNFALQRTHKHGFTLIELIIAIAIFSMIALATGAVFTTIKSSNDNSQIALKDLQAIQRTMLIMERDFLQMVARAPKVSGQEGEPFVIKGGNFEFESDEDAIGFVRNGWHNPQFILPRSTLQNVVYRLQDKQLQRLHTNHVDSVIGTEPKVRVLYEGVTDFQVEAAFEFTNDELDFVEKIEKTSLPIAIKITLETDAYGTIIRMFQVAP
ncbi:type II secretion system minor pseudopilin GspJ [Agaribacter marinus]|uniref:Type II secretion system protein J n=1 Tax=Agaribacter marinus TaxID=1431249 RepID=A0AA37WKE5_9ALTE|nr:type II secretion system minor pseudopilin GspJ [Agaribacter marinus]GLR71449.1 type II secretion system protein GspJ [Agaribacter marinus]